MLGPSTWSATLCEAVSGRAARRVTLCDYGQRAIPRRWKPLGAACVRRLTLSSDQRSSVALTSKVARCRSAPPGRETAAAQHLVDEVDRRRLVTGVVDLEHADARAVVDGRELIQPLPRARDALEELHVHLQAMTRLRLLIPLPPLRLRSRI